MISCRFNGHAIAWLIVWFVMVALAPGVSLAQSSNQPVVFTHTLMQQCPAPLVFSHFYGQDWLHAPREDTPAYRSSTWCGAAQKIVENGNINLATVEPEHLPITLLRCTPGQEWWWLTSNPAMEIGPFFSGISLVCLPVERKITIYAASPIYANQTVVVLARVTRQDGQQEPNVQVTMNVGGPNQGQLIGCNALTDSAGQLYCSFKAPSKSGSATLHASCDGCSTSASTNVTVMPLVEDPESCANEGNPINPASGEKIQAETDYLDAAAHPLGLVRVFRSGRVPGVGSDTGLGQMWSHNYSHRLVVEADAARVVMGDGAQIGFSRTGGSANGPWTPVAGVDQLMQVTDGYRFYRQSDDSTWRFDAVGRLQTITARNGWALTFIYSGNLLTQVRNHFGRTLSFSYDQAGRLVLVVAPDGSTVQYALDAQARLSLAQFSDGRSRTYLYESNTLPLALTGIVDEAGNRYASFEYYPDGRAASTQHANGVNRYSMTYGANATYIVDPLGMQRTKRYAAEKGRLIVAYVDVPDVDRSPIHLRQQSENGLLISDTDFLGITQLYTWDAARELTLSTTRAAGRPEAQTVQTQWHAAYRLPTQVTESGRQTNLEYDTQGNLTRRVVSDMVSGASQAWSYAWADGLMTAETDPLGRTTRYEYDATGNAIRVVNALGQATVLAYDAGGRVTQATSPGGIVTRYVYDARGRMISRSITPAGGGAAEIDAFAFYLNP